MGIIDCGGCEGNKTRVIASLGLLKMQLLVLNESIDAIHIGTCIMKLCPRRDDLINSIKETTGVEIVEGAHAYVPPQIF